MTEHHDHDHEHGHDEREERPHEVAGAEHPPQEVRRIGHDEGPRRQFLRVLPQRPDTGGCGLRPHSSARTHASGLPSGVPRSPDEAGASSPSRAPVGVPWAGSAARASRLGATSLLRLREDRYRKGPSRKPLISDLVREPGTSSSVPATRAPPGLIRFKMPGIRPMRVPRTEGLSMIAFVSRAAMPEPLPRICLSRPASSTRWRWCTSASGVWTMTSPVARMRANMSRSSPPRVEVPAPRAGSKGRPP